MPQEETHLNEMNCKNTFEMIDSTTFTRLMDLIPYNIYIKLNAQELINLAKIMYEQEKYGMDKFYDEHYETFQLGCEYEQILENRCPPDTYVTYTVKIRSENKIVRVLETFTNYNDAVMFIENSEDVLSGQYFIVFSEHDTDGNEICSGIVN
jgi:hypothetical protein